MMERKTLAVPSEFKAVGDHGEVEGFASVFGNIDEDNDVALPGMFKVTLEHWSRARQPLPLIADHELKTSGVIGSVRDARETAEGLRYRAGFASTQKAQDVRRLVLEGHLGGSSFTYQPVKTSRGVKDGQQVRFLHEVRLFEITITPFPMNQMAMIAAKGVGAGGDDVHQVVEELAELERWARGAQAEAGLYAMATASAGDLLHLARLKTGGELASLERWALSQPTPHLDPGGEVTERGRARVARFSAEQDAMAAWEAKQATIGGCGYCGFCKSGAPSACAYG
jgi:Escherichia/Staphylococcus phage prohead protease